VGEGTDAARAAVLTARGSVEDELDRLEASARAAVESGWHRRTARAGPVARFLLLGGPRRVIRGARNVVFGRPDPLPKSMLPKEIDKAIRALGDDGEKVRGTIEREFAEYLRATGPERRKRDLSGVLALLLASVASRHRQVRRRPSSASRSPTSRWSPVPGQDPARGGSPTRATARTGAGGTGCGAAGGPPAAVTVPPGARGRPRSW
jgi:hypothetical protein